MGPERRYLVVTRIGRKSLHANWLRREGARNFDVVLSAYDRSVSEMEGSGIVFEYRPGTKVKGYKEFLESRRDLWTSYDYICLLDEDIEVSAERLSEIFVACADYGLKIAQPALSHDSYFTYAGVLQQPAWKIRYVNFIEMMCPVFQRETLAQVVPLYALGFESGIDLVWCNLVGRSEKDFAVLDFAAVRHTEPVGGNKAANGFVAARRYEDDVSAVLAMFGLPWLSCVPFAAVAPSGREVRARLRLFLAVLPLFAAVPRRRPMLPRLRAVLVHTRHLLIRIPRNMRVDLAPPDPTRC